MFSFLKKKTKNSPEEGEKSEKEAAKKEIRERMEREIAIHTMPERFRLDSAKAAQAKTTGVVVMVVGLIFIVILVILLYLFIFRGDKPANQDGIESQPLVKENQVEFEDGLEEELEGLPVENNDSVLPATSTPEDLVEEATSTPPLTINSLLDSDGDGLTAKEELLLGLSDENIDTDADGYTDLSELNNLYDPAGTGRLLDNINIGKYENRTFAYSIFYPLGWTRTAVGGNDSIMFKSPDDNFIQVIVQANLNKQTIEDWYEEQFGFGSYEPEQKLSGSGWSGLKNEDGSVVYLTDDDNNYIFSLSYNSRTGEIFSYKNIFNLMLKSFVIEE